MSQKHTVKPLAVCIGAVLAGSVTGGAVASTVDNPFAMSELSSGYMQLAEAEGKCGEGKCGGEMKAGAEGKCGEGKCGGEMKAGAEGKCGEGKCGGEMKTDAEGKCGEGKCGGAK